jgi:anti-sigma factor RsiW
MTTHRCPDEESLAAYFDGLLTPPEERRFLAGLRGCSDCIEMVAALGFVIEAESDAYRTMTVPAGVTARAKALWPAAVDPVTRAMRLAVRWIGDALSPLADALQPVGLPAVAMRGAAAVALDELFYEVSLGDTAYTISVEVDGPAEVAVSVRSVQAPPPGLMLRLRCDGETRAMSSLGATGTTISALPVGIYEMTLEQADRAVGQLELVLEA